MINTLFLRTLSGRPTAVMPTWYKQAHKQKQTHKREAEAQLTAHFDALIRTIFTVGLAIAVPPLGDALTIPTDKVHLLACLPHCNNKRKKVRTVFKL